VLDRLSQHFDIETNQPDEVWPKEELARRMSDKVGASPPAASALTRPCWRPARSLKIVANMAVGYNNFDVDAMSARGVLATNAPDVLTETTADFGFALLMATARRVTESEHYLRAGKWTKWNYDMFSGSDVHGATLGILGMGRIGQGIAKRGAHGFGMNVIYHNRSRPDARSGGGLQGPLCQQGRIAARLQTTWCWCCRIQPRRITPLARPSWP
jgi:gluconate 2-dehydrogenase